MACNQGDFTAATINFGQIGYTNIFDPWVGTFYPDYHVREIAMVDAGGGESYIRVLVDSDSGVDPVPPDLFETFEYEDQSGTPFTLVAADATIIEDPERTTWTWPQEPQAQWTAGSPQTVEFCISSTLAEIPSVVLMTAPNYVTTITGAGFVVGAVVDEASLTVPAGAIIRQSPVAGTIALTGTAVDLVRSSGGIVVPDLYAETAAEANAEILAVGLPVGEASSEVSSVVKYGSVVSQFPLAGTLVLPGTAVSYAISIPGSDFNVDATVISQYANSPTLLALVHNMDQYVKKGLDLAKFYQFVWNLDTAVGFGLDVWGRIVGVSRLLQIPGNDPIVGFDNPSFPNDWTPMSYGRFAMENEATTSYTLPDDGYRVLILTKALSNIITTTAPAINQLLKNMFPNRGRAYVRDLGNMAMQFVFNFALTTVEYAILTQSGALPHPAGVFYSVIVVRSGLFGFQGQGPTVRPFNYGVFNSRP